MSHHLPECPRPFGVEPHVCTVCAALRACEQRVREDEHIRTLNYMQTGNTVMNVFGTYYGQGYAAGVKAARDAVAAADCWYASSAAVQVAGNDVRYVVQTDALAAIDALRGES